MGQIIYFFKQDILFGGFDGIDTWNIEPALIGSIEATIFFGT